METRIPQKNKQKPLRSQKYTQKRPTKTHDPLQHHNFKVRIVNCPNSAIANPSAEAT